MANFEVKAYRLTIEDHPNADVIELARVGDYRSIVRKGQFKTGDLAVYIPEAAIVPDWIIERLGLEGKLAGKKKNRVKAIKLRGILSQGLIVPLEFRENVLDQDTHEWSDEYVLTLKNRECNAGIRVKEGDDVAELLGIVKWEPPIPTCMTGEVDAAFGKTLRYDIENLKKFTDVFAEGEEVCVSEKLHGTWTCFGYHPRIEQQVVTSKGLSGKGLIFKINDANVNNLYIRQLDDTTDDSGNNVVDRAHIIFGHDEPFYILGETFGANIQDLVYGGDKATFRIFDIYVGEPGKGKYLDVHAMGFVADALGVQTVPILYIGAYSAGMVEHFTNGEETISGKGAHMREGIVIKPVTERRDDELGRVMLKSVSEAYLLRKGKPTEYS